MPIEESTEERRRRQRRERQQRWRERTAGLVADDDDESEGGRAPRGLGSTLTMHLTARECAVLDSIAAQLYRDNPHVPSEGLVGDPVVFPGRPAAVRWLVDQYLDKHRIRRPASRAACGEFWRAESAFRKATQEGTAAEAPVPPWLNRKR